MRSTAALGVALAARLQAASAGDFAGQCADLAKVLTETINNTTVESTTFIGSGSPLLEPARHESCAPLNFTTTFDFCRVQLTLHTGPDSAVRMESWLPADWNGRFLMTGNGGLGGCIGYESMSYAANRAFATVGTNNGHDGNWGQPFYKHPGVVEDYAYRAIHLGTQVGKQTTELMYGKQHDKAYYLGCSTGGRQGFMEAQNFPDDFDGIVAGAPAFDFTGLQVASGGMFGFTGTNESATFLTPEEWSLVVNDTLAQCDHFDGQVDGVIEDPDLCQYRPERLLCAPGESENCLTPTQVGTVRNILSPVYDTKGKLVYPRMQPGVDSSRALWSGAPFSYAVEWWRYVIYENTSFDGAITVADIEPAREAETYGVDAFDGDLSGIRDSGGKILHYHGLQDPLISSDNSARYYNHVLRTMDLRSAELDDFYRYFRISGMAHCSGGSGASNILTQAGDGGVKPEDDALAAIVRWVEQGEAPEHVLGTAFTDGSRKEVKLQRQHCRYPLRNVYVEGDPNLPESWQCQ
ncbi:tannase and feruloyl esterase domain-containing protein [Sarocladium implicatum]|nr:tannase and feruloyl esterase domain-containing protein [Sarocladium implicatum]